MNRRYLLLFGALWGLCLVAEAQNRIGTGAVQRLYNTHCASCHGENLKGSLGGSLLKGQWSAIAPETGFVEYVKRGDTSMGMPGFGDVLSDAEIRSLEVYIDEVRRKQEAVAGSAAIGETEDGETVYQAGGYKFRVEKVVDGLSTPWAIAFLPSGGILISEKSGSLRIFQDGELSEPIEGTPKVWNHGQGGLLEVALHPEYRKNGWVYLGFSASSGSGDAKKKGMTKVVRGRILDHFWMDEEVIFETPVEFHLSAGVHFGTRFVFKDGYLFFGIGDRGSMDMAQDLTRPNGKIHRVFDDGRVPGDNPFADNPEAYPTIWTYGNRNPQGLDLNVTSGKIWESEHGPRGGDEINLIESGVNYGWPVITHGINYDGRPITDRTAHPGMAQPAHYWTPSIAVCGIDFYEGEQFPEWKGNLFAGGLASEELHRLVIEGTEVVSDEIILKDLGRIRDVATGPEGALYLVLNGPDRVVRLVPSE